MKCDKCEKDKLSVMPRMAPKGAERLDGTYCAACCVEVLPNRGWMKTAADEEDANA